MSLALHIDDGNFSVSAQNGPFEYRYPFADKGDITSFIAKRKMRLRASSFTPPTAMTSLLFAGQYGLNNLGILTTPATGYLVTITDPQEIGNALLEWTEEYACVPRSRVEFGSQSYTQLVLSAGAGGSIIVGSNSYSPITGILDAATLYEYARIPEGFIFDTSFAQPVASGFSRPWAQTVLPTLFAPRYVAIDGRVFLYGDPAAIVAQSGPILSQDTTTDIYMGAILCRKSIYVNRQTPSQIS